MRPHPISSTKFLYHRPHILQETKKILSIKFNPKFFKNKYMFIFINYQMKKIDTDIRDSTSYPIFKKRVLEIIRPHHNRILKFSALLF